MYPQQTKNTMKRRGKTADLERKEPIPSNEKSFILMLNSNSSFEKFYSILFLLLY